MELRILIFDNDIGACMPLTSIRSKSNLIDLKELPSYLVDRPPIVSYHPNQTDNIKRAYLFKRAFQPRSHNFEFEILYGKRHSKCLFFTKTSFLVTNLLCCRFSHKSRANILQLRFFATKLIAKHLRRGYDTCHKLFITLPCSF